MPDELYHEDVLVWSERQAERLRRVAHGERVNDVDWEHVIEEIEDVGVSELHAVQSLLQQAIVHLLKVYGWPIHRRPQPLASRDRRVPRRRGTPLRALHAPAD